MRRAFNVLARVWAKVYPEVVKTVRKRAKRWVPMPVCYMQKGTLGNETACWSPKRVGVHVVPQAWQHVGVDPGSEVWCFSLNRAGGGKAPSNMGPLRWWALNPSYMQDNWGIPCTGNLTMGMMYVRKGRREGKKTKNTFQKMMLGKLLLKRFVVIKYSKGCER